VDESSDAVWLLIVVFTSYLCPQH